MGLVAEAHTELVGVDTSKAEHEGGRLHTALGIAFLTGDASAPGDIGIASAINDNAAESGFATRFAFGDNAAEAVPCHDRAGEPGVETDFHATLKEHFHGDGFNGFRVDEGKAHVEGTRAMLAGGADESQPIDEFLGKPGDDGPGVLIEKAEDRQADGEVPAKVATALDEHHRKAFFGSGKGSHNAGGTAPNNENVDFPGDRGGPGGFLYGVHVYAGVQVQELKTTLAAKK